MPIVVLALLAVTAGALAVARRRAAARAGARSSPALIGLAGGYAATRSGDGNLERVVVWGALLASTLRYATPLTSARSAACSPSARGVINIALEGMMLMGAFFGAWGADKTGSWVLGHRHRGRSRARCSRRCTRCSRSRCAPTRSSPARR